MHFIYRDYENNPICEVKVSRNKKKVELINYEQNPLFRPFGHDEEITYENVIAFLESRCYQRNYAAIDDVLKEVGIKTYDPREDVCLLPRAERCGRRLDRVPRGVIWAYPRIRNAEQVLSSVIADNRAGRERNFQSRQ